jgi:hypothetical protein
VILEHLDVGMERQRGQQRALDFAPGHVLGVEDAPLGVAALLAEIELVPATVFALGERHAQLDQFPDPRRALLDDPAHHLLAAEPAPASSVSRTCRSKVSSVEVTQAMPPCA